MAGLKEIRRRLQSVKNTQKITYAMKLVSAAKLRKAQESVTNARSYTAAINHLLSEILEEGGDYSHPLMQQHETPANIRVLVIGAARGLCGGYNSNINKRVEAFIKERSGAGHKLDWMLVGKKPAEYFRRLNRAYVKAWETLPEDANRWPIDDICFELERDFLSGAVHEVHMIYTRFKSAISMSVMCEKILPLDAGLLAAAQAERGLHAVKNGVTLYEPSVNQLFSALMPRILRAKVRQAALDAKASEQGARMTAMDSASKNAGDLIRKLELTRNKLRQGGITSELLDIIGGAEALK